MKAPDKDNDSSRGGVEKDVHVVLFLLLLTGFVVVTKVAT